MRVKVLGAVEAKNFNEIFNLRDNALGSELREAVSDKLEGVEVELFCMGRVLSDQDTVPAGCVIHMRTVQTNRPPAFQAPEQPAQPARPRARADSDPSRDPGADAEILYDEEAGPQEVLGQNWNDPEVIAQYRARLAERGVDPEEAQRKLTETIRVIKKYQHFVLFYTILILLDLVSSPALSHKVVDMGGNPPDQSGSWKVPLLGTFTYKSCLSGLWWINFGVSIIVLVGVIMGEQSASLVSMHRGLQYIFVLFNIYFLAGSGFRLPPFNSIIDDGHWVALACAVLLEMCFRGARIYISYGYTAVYNSLNQGERDYAHNTLCNSILTGELEPAQQQGGPNPGLQMA